jgi:anti-sigma regulatory factor (Ser/Thr protein kinase)
VERRFPRDINALPALFDFVAEFGASIGMGEDRRYDLDLILEELFTNMIKYNRETAEPVRIELRRRESAVVATLRDVGVHPFDPTRVSTEFGAASPDGLHAGGRGLHLVRQYADDLQYEHQNDASTITVTLGLNS